MVFLLYAIETRVFLFMLQHYSILPPLGVFFFYFFQASEVLSLCRCTEPEIKLEN